MSNDLVVKANEVIEAGYHLTASEQRLIISAVAKIPKNIEVSDDIIYVVTAQDFIDLGVHPKTAYRDLKDAATKLYERSVSIKMKGVYTSTRWIQQKLVGIEGYEGDEGDSDLYSNGVGLRFSKPVLPYLSNLSNNFTKYLKEDIAGISSGYTIRLYELMCQHRQFGKRRISLSDLRFMLDLQDKYPAPADLKRWVLQVAVDEINEKSPLNATFELVKTGRKYTHVDLKFWGEKSLNSPATNKDEAKRPTWETKGLSDKQITKIGCNIKEFVDANSSKVSPKERRQYPAVFEDWKPLLKDPKTVCTFNMVQELLDRPRSS